MQTNPFLRSWLSVFRFSIVSFFWLLFFASPCASQVQPHETRLNRFISAFPHFAAREKVAIVTEDVPFRENLTEEQVRKLLAEIQTENNSERYQAIAKAYDYECIQRGDVLVLRKLFSDIEDLPYVPYEEARSALERIERSLRSLNPPGPESGWPNSAYLQLLGSITDEQMQHLKEKVPVTTLSLEQRQLLQTVCAKEYMQTFATLSRINTWYIKQLQEPETIFRWVQVIPDTPQILILDGPLGLRGGRSQKGLSHGFTFGNGGPSDLRNPIYLTQKNRAGFATSLFIRDWDAAQAQMWKDTLTDLSDRTAPPPGARPTPVSPARLTLAQVVERLNARAAGQEYYQLDPVLNHKTVCLFGIENASPRAVFESLATLYDLDISSPEDRILRLVPPRLSRVRGYSDVLTVLQ